MSQITHENAFPSVMRDKLQSVRWRQAGLSAARAIAIGASVLLAAMIVAMLIDWSVTLFDTRIRILLTTTTLLLGVMTLLMTGVRSVISAFGWTRAAGNVDDRIPVLEERWRTVASFAKSGQQPASVTAKAMLQQVTSEAVAMSTLVKPRQVVRGVSLRRPGISLAGACLALTGFMLINLPQTSVLMQRFWSPTLNISATQLKCVTGDVVVPRGQSLEIVTRMSGLHRASAMMAMTHETAAGVSAEIELKPVTDKPGMLSVAVDVDESFKYRVQAGDGRTEWHSVTAIDFPMFSDIRLTVTPPDYIDEPVTEKTLIPGRIRAIQGSRFELAMKPEQELKSLTLVLTLPVVEKSDAQQEESAATDEAPAVPVAQEEPDAARTIQRTLTLTRGDDGWYHFETQLVENFTLSPMLVSPHGLTNENPRVCRIEVIEDKAPVARIISPNAETSVSPDETIEIKFEAHDDHGILTAELVVYDTETKEGEEPKILAVRQIPLGDQQLQKHVMGKTELDLKELGLEEGKSISYAVRVTDNRMLEMDPESVRNRLIASSEPKSESEAGDKEAAEPGSESESGKTDKNAESKGEESLAKADADSKAGEPKSPSETSGNDPKEGDPSAADPESSKTNTLIADAGDQPLSADPYEKMLANDRDRKNAEGEPTASADPQDGAKGTKSANPKNSAKDTAADTEASSDSKDPAASDATENNPAGIDDPKGNDAQGNDPKENDAERESTTNDTKNDPASDRIKDSAQDPAAPDKAGLKQENADDSKGDPSTDASEAAKTNQSSSPDDNDMPQESAETAAEGEPQSAEAEPLDGKTPNGDAQNADPSKNGNPEDAGDSKSNDGKSKDKDANGDDAKPEDPEMIETAIADARTPNDSDAEFHISDLKSQIANNPEDGKNNSNSNPQNAPKPEDQKPNSTAAKNSSQEPQSTVKMRGQRSDAGQQQETDRQKLKISGRLDALAERDKDQKQLENPVRAKVVQIDKMLEVIEAKLGALYKHEVDESLRGDSFREQDVRLGDVEGFVADLSVETQNTAFEFVGLQMIDISSSHVTPARDAVFVAIRKPDSGADVHAEEALHHVVSARELLLALLRKYDSVVQEQELAKKIDEAIKMYTVYVEGSQQLLREAQQNFDPLKLQREMAVVEVDQAYLDRLAEVTRMRRDMMSELAKILGDDPRLRSRYLDLIKRNRASLRSHLAELAARQDQAAQEVMGWLSVSENQRENYWLQVSDLRLDLPKELAKEAQQFADRVDKQMPLVLDATQGTAARTIQLAKQIALDVRRCDFEVRELRKAGGEATSSSGLSTSANDLVFRIGELAAALDEINFDGEGQEVIAEYVTLRLAENRALADQADIWAATAAAIEQKQYFGLAHLDQQQITVLTELLRMEMLNIETDLAGQFNEENPMPQEVINLTQDLLRGMESLTFNQSSATFAFSRDRIETGAAQQKLALKGFEEAGKILDQLRRKTIEVLDKVEIPDPNIADLVDPTLDAFLASLEREPDIESQLGLPNRPRNIRVLQDAMQWQQNGGAMLGSTGEAAMARIQQQIKQKLNKNGGEQKKPDQELKDTREMSEEEKQQLAESKDMQQMLKDKVQQTMKELEEKAKDPSQSDEQRRQMIELAQRMSKALEEMKDGQNPEQLWRQMVEADQAKAALEALAKGETLPDNQWNGLMSTLDDGLGQVAGRTPPEDYRKAIEQYQERIRQLTGGAGGG